jgi:DNA-directed RNA polymerase specialized sigma24 family protein
MSGLLAGMKSGDDEAARRIWERCSPRLTDLARRRLPVWLRCACEDIANSAFYDVVVGLREGRFPDLEDREALWALLARITVCKALNAIKRETRQKRLPPCTGEPLDEGLLEEDSPPDLKVLAAEQFAFLIDRLHRKDELLETIALWKFEGYTSDEIARRLGCSCRRVARKLELIRKTWVMEEPR